MNSVIRTIDARACDVLVVGGGIAGVSISERLAREARRRGQALRLILVDQNEQLGSASSGGLEGWFHTGALYAKLEDERCFFSFVAGCEDLYKWYAGDPLFGAALNCNLRTISSDSPLLSYDFIAPVNRWFISPISYLLGRDLGDRAIQLRDRISRTFYGVGGTTWWDAPTGTVRAPHADELRERSQPTYPGDPGDLLQMSSPSNGSDLPATPVPTRDAVMRTRQVLTDLTSSATTLGVTVMTGHRLVRESIRAAVGAMPSGDTGLLLEGPAGPVVVNAKQYVFALGGGLNPADFPQALLGIESSVEKRTCIMIVLAPALRTDSFALINHNVDNDFNHIFHPWTTDTASPGYSIVADSHTLAIDATDAECAQVAKRLLEKTRHHFPAVGSDYRYAWYRCVKAEVPTDPRTLRGYGYWFGPQMTNGTTRPNYLCVLPGKFSTFPALAQRAYLELEARGLFDGLSIGSQPPEKMVPVALTHAEALAQRLCGRAS